MAIQIEIRDGNPWYLSTDIWVVPGADPLGALGSPVAGEPAYIWARVQNSGNSDADGVRVDFYWANPALQVTRSNANFVGSAFVDVPVGGSMEVLCLVAWVPVIVNDGHECLIAVANHPGDALPSPLPDAFDPPVYRQIAQRNLGVLSMPAIATTVMLTVTVAALARVDKEVEVIAEIGGQLDEKSLGTLGLGDLRPAKESGIEVGLSRNSGCPSHDKLGEQRLKLAVKRGTSVAVYAAVRNRGLGQTEYALLHISERQGDRILGGLALVVVDGRNGEAL